MKTSPHSIQHRQRVILGATVILLCHGCASNEPAPPPQPAPIPPTVINLQLDAGSQLNPDNQGRVSPLIIRIYQFEAVDNFNRSDFFALYENDQTLLAKDIKFRQELELKPSEKREIRLDIKNDAHYLGVFAAYRNLDKAQWRASVAIPAQQTTTVNGVFDQSAVRLTAKPATP